MRESAGELARRLAKNAEGVCRRYLSNGRREGRYWSVGDLQNTPGRSLYVRLHGSSDGALAAGKWTDAATGKHGDLLDLIAAAERHTTLAETLEAARGFLGAEPTWPTHDRLGASTSPAERLWAASRPIRGTLAQGYLRARGLRRAECENGLRFHPRCYYRPHAGAEPQAWPALIAAVTDDAGQIVGAHRTWLNRGGADKAPVSTPRRAMGRILRAAVRFGDPGKHVVVGEGIETVLSVREVLDLPAAAALSAAHLAAFTIPIECRRLYVAQDNDAAGRRATETLIQRANAQGTEALVLTPRLKDFNDDLREFGPEALAAELRPQQAPEDVEYLQLCPSSGSALDRIKGSSSASEDRARG